MAIGIPLKVPHGDGNGQMVPRGLMARPSMVAEIVRRFGLAASKFEVVADDHYGPASAADFEV